MGKVKKFINSLKKPGLIFFKVFSGFCLAYVLSLIGKELLSYGSFAFVFLLVSITSGFFYLIKSYKFSSVLLIDLVLVLLALALKYYVLLAYSS